MQKYKKTSKCIEAYRTIWNSMETNIKVWKHIEDMQIYRYIGNNQETDATIQKYIEHYSSICKNM